VILSAEQEGDHIAITISDDGAGMDPDKLRNIAISKGVLDEESAARLSDHECYNLIFAPVNQGAVDAGNHAYVDGRAG
jgi:two-component system chemotaxis sensor kinase CheA